MTSPDEPTECPPVDRHVGGEEGGRRDQGGATIVTPVVQDPAGPSQASTAGEKSSPADGTPVTNIIDQAPADPISSAASPADPTLSVMAPPAGPPSKVGQVPRTVFDFREMEARWKLERDYGNVGDKEPTSRGRKPKGPTRAPGAVSFVLGKRQEGNPGAAHQADPDHPSPFSQATSMYLRNIFGGPQSKRIEKLLVKYL